MHPPPSDPRQTLADRSRRLLDRLRQANGYRTRRIVRAIDSTHIEVDGKRYVNFASNDYLGLSFHPAVRAAAGKVLHNESLGSGASPLVTGYSPHHASAEAALARWKGTEAAVLLNSGFAANVAAVQAL